MRRRFVRFAAEKGGLTLPLQVTAGGWLIIILYIEMSVQRQPFSMSGRWRIYIRKGAARRLLRPVSDEDMLKLLKQQFRGSVFLSFRVRRRIRSSSQRRSRPRLAPHGTKPGSYYARPSSVWSPPSSAASRRVSTFAEPPILRATAAERLAKPALRRCKTYF